MARRRVEGWFSILVLGLVLLLAVLAQGLKEEPKARAHSVTSGANDGRRAFFLLLQQLGFAPIAWTRPPGELPHGEHVLWLPERPHPWKPHKETEAPGQAGESISNLLPGHDLAHYRSFVEEGGTLLAPVNDEMLAFLRDELELAGVEALERESAGARALHHVRLESGELLALELERKAALRPFPAGSPWRELWLLQNEAGEQGAEDLVAVEFPLGAGRIVLLSEDRFLDNDRIRKHEHALAGVRLIEQLSRGGQLYFDEYALGTWEPQSALSLSASPRIFLLSVHLLALLTLFIWAQAWTRAFPRDPPPLAVASPLERAQVQARIWRSAGRLNLAARALRRGALARLERTAGLRSRRAAAEAEGEAGRTALRLERLVAAHRRLAADPERARQALRERAPATIEELDALARELDALEGRGAARG